MFENVDRLMMVGQTDHSVTAHTYAKVYLCKIQGLFKDF